MENMVNGPEMPMGLGMALAKNQSAMNYFSSLLPEKQQSIIDQTHSIQSKAEMSSFVDTLGKGL
ncbi:MAG: hypothetical protein ACRDBM_06570 [Sporomusa sp.]